MSSLVQMPTQLKTGIRSRPVAYGVTVPREMEHPGKPAGGMWTSTLESSDEDGWLNWCFHNMPEWLKYDYGWALEPWPCRVLAVCTDEDFWDFHERYGGPLVNDKGDELDLDMIKRINWDAIRAEFDAIWVPSPRRWSFRLYERKIPPITFDTWDCESTLWLRWSFWKARKVSLQPLIERMKGERDGAVSTESA